MQLTSLYSSSISFKQMSNFYFPYGRHVKNKVHQTAPTYVENSGCLQYLFSKSHDAKYHKYIDRHKITILYKVSTKIRNT